MKVESGVHWLCLDNPRDEVALYMPWLSKRRQFSELLAGLTVKRIPASNPDHIWLVLEWPEGDKIRSHEVHESYDYYDWKLQVGSKA